MAIDQQAADRVKIMYADLAPLSPTPTHLDLRRGVDAMYAKIPMPEDIEIEEVDADGRRSLWVRAPGTSEDRLVVHYHGGAYIANSPENYREYGYRLSQACDAKVLLPSYRQAPEHTYPTAHEDALVGYRWLAKQFDPAQIAISGDSAGCGLTLAVCLQLREAGEPLPAAIALVSAYINMACNTPGYDTNAGRDATMFSKESIIGLSKVYLGDRDPEKTPLANPFYADLAGLPPMYVAVGGNELLIDDSRLLVEKAQAAGVHAEFEIAEDMEHVYTMAACILPEARTTFGNIGRFFKTHLK